MAVIVADVFSIMVQGYFASTTATITVGAPPPSKGGKFEQLLNRIGAITHETQDGTFNDYGEANVVETTVTGIKTRLNEEVNTYVQDGKVLNVKEYIAFFMPTTEIFLRDTVSIENKDYEVTDVDLIYKRRSLHHLEVTLERMV